MAVPEPQKFQTLLETVRKRGQQHTQAQSAAIRPIIVVPIAPTSRVDAALLYLELAKACLVPPSAVHAHLIGKLALVDQKPLTDTALRERIRQLENLNAWDQAKSGVGCLDEIKAELRQVLALASHQPASTDPDLETPSSPEGSAGACG